jgi:hypothetical protein
MLAVANGGIGWLSRRVGCVYKRREADATDHDEQEVDAGFELHEWDLSEKSV